MEPSSVQSQHIPMAVVGGPEAVPAENRPVVNVIPATLADLPGILEVVNKYSRRGDLLPRSEESIRNTINNWVIAKTEDGVVLGVGSLLFYTPVLAEVRSLAVADEAQGLGLGGKIVARLIAEARHLRVPTLFALTRAVGFFQRMGFSITEKELFPQKVWTDCAICPLKDNCDETAVVLELND